MWGRWWVIIWFDELGYKALVLRYRRLGIVYKSHIQGFGLQSW